MKRRLLSYRTLGVAASAAVALSSLPAYAQQAKIKQNGSDKWACTFTGQVSITSSGSIVIDCVDTLTAIDPNTPPPVTPTPTPSPTPTPAPTGCATPATEPHVPRASFGPPSTSLVHSGLLGTTYSYPLPKNNQGVHGAGIFTHFDDPAGGGGIYVEVSISKCPGDTEYSKGPGAITTSGRSIVTLMPCRSVASATSGGVSWSSDPNANTCRVNNTDSWYINIRYLSGCTAGVMCPVDYTHIEY